MVSRRWAPSSDRQVLATLILVLASSVIGCSSEPKGGNSNSGAPSAPQANSNASASPEAASPGSAIDIKEPDRFNIAMTIGVQETNADSAKMPTLQFNLSKLDEDRRWAFSFPAPLGPVVYLEKSGLKYLILTASKQYTEVTPNDLGFQLGRELTPSAVATRLKARARVETLGVEPVNGRTARKYRFRASGDSVPADGVIYLDLETGLPVRIEVNGSTASGKALRTIVECREIQLNPDRSQFDVPAGLKKVSAQQAREQIETFAGILRSFAETLSGSPASMPRDPQGVTNKNAARPRR